MTRRGYGLGGRTVDIVDGAPGPSPGQLDSQDVNYPAMRDYDLPDDLTLDHKRQTLSYDGEVEPERSEGEDTEGEGEDTEDGDRHGDMGWSPKELVHGRMEPPLSFGELWTPKHPNENAIEDVDVRLGQRDRPPWVAVDLDGTILEKPDPATYGDIAVGEQPELGEPLDGAREVLTELMSLGWRVSIYTARLEAEHAEVRAQEIEGHLRSQEIPFTDVWIGMKPRADYFVDDKAIRFDGDWEAILMALVGVEGERGGVEPERSEGEYSGIYESPNDFLDPTEVREDRDAPGGFGARG